MPFWQKTKPYIPLIEDKIRYNNLFNVKITQGVNSQSLEPEAHDKSVWQYKIIMLLCMNEYKNYKDS